MRARLLLGVTLLWERELYFRGESQNEGFGGAGSGSLGRAAAESASAAWRRRRPKLRRHRAPYGGGCQGWGPARRQSGARPPRRLQRGLGTRSPSSRPRWESTCRPRDRTGGEATASPAATEDGARPGVSPAAPGPAGGTGPAAPDLVTRPRGTGRARFPCSAGRWPGPWGQGRGQGAGLGACTPGGAGSGAPLDEPLFPEARRGPQDLRSAPARVTARPLPSGSPCGTGGGTDAQRHPDVTPRFPAAGVTLGPPGTPARGVSQPRREGTFAPARSGKTRKRDAAPKR